LLLPDDRVIVEYLLPLPPQNACARCCQQCRHQDDGQPRLADHRPGVYTADSIGRKHSVVAGAADTRQLHDHPGAEEHAGHA
ncbi:hypothetical protein FG573_024200, partial [Salmonella enterica subsp. enterica serovar Derby]